MASRQKAETRFLGNTTYKGWWRERRNQRERRTRRNIWEVKVGRKVLRAGDGYSARGRREMRQRMVTGNGASNREGLEPGPHLAPGRHRLRAQA